jgi:putative endonuclease
MKDRDDRKAVGGRGEKTAENYLRRKGYAILKRNYRCPRGEIDLVARKNKMLVFVEVKTGRSGSFGDPAEWVGWKKQRRLNAAAEYYLQAHDLENTECRFDVIALRLDRGDVRIRHIEDAFWQEEGGGWI